jgi:hypothetical protein
LASTHSSLCPGRLDGSAVQPLELHRPAQVGHLSVCCAEHVGHLSVCCAEHVLR